MYPSTLLATCVAYVALPSVHALAAPETRHLAAASIEEGADQARNQHKSHGKASHRSVLASEIGIVHKTEYWGKVFVGTPPKEFSVIFDTGSGNLILPSSRCTSLPCQYHEKYDPHASTSSLQIGGDGKHLRKDVMQDRHTTITFGTGSIHGQFYQDKLCLSRETGCYKAHFIGTDYESDEPFNSCSFDGIMGLGFKDLSIGEGFNMIDDVVSQHSLPSNIFSIYLRDHKQGSEISFGGYKHSQAASDILWAPVTQKSYWQIGIDDVTFDNKRTGLCSKCQVAVDTGTSMLAGPTDVIEKLESKLNLRSDCSNFHTMPLLGFTFRGKVLNMLPDDYIERVQVSTRSICSLSLMTVDVPPPKGPLFILGDPFLRRYLTIYDRDGPRVGFAVAWHEGITSKAIKKFIADASSTPAPTNRNKSDSFRRDQDHEADFLALSNHTQASAPPVDRVPTWALRGSTDKPKNSDDQIVEQNKEVLDGAGTIQTQIQKESGPSLITISLARRSVPH
jgi:hypothetical protein